MTPSGQTIGYCLVSKNLEILWTNRVMEYWFGSGDRLIGEKCYACFENACH